MFEALKNEFDQCLFVYPARNDRRRLVYFALLAAMYYMGYFYWSVFFNQGLMIFNTADWDEKWRALRLMQMSIEQQVIPYHSTVRLSNWHRSLRFWSMPHIVVSPQLLLLKYMDIGPYLLANMRIFYTIGFAGCLLLIRRYRLAIAPAFILYLLFNFNGYVVSHLAVGHSEWFGYFLFPWFVYYTFVLVETDEIAIPSMAISMIQFAMVLQGAFHFMIWDMMFLAILWACHPRKRLALCIVSISLQTVFLCAIRVVPAMMTIKTEQLEYVPGYPSLKLLLDALIVIGDIDTPGVKSLFGIVPTSWWEYDMYISEFGLFFLLYFGVYLRRPGAGAWAGRRHAELDWPILALFFLSLGHVYFVLFYETHFPVIGNAERAPSRFIIMPVLFLIALASLQFQRFLDRRRNRLTAPIRIATLLGTLCGAFLLLTHLRLWSISHIEQKPPIVAPSIPGELAPAILDDEYSYIRTANLAITITLISLFFWTVILLAVLRDRRRKRRESASAGAAQTAV